MRRVLAVGAAVIALLVTLVGVLAAVGEGGPPPPAWRLSLAGAVLVVFLLTGMLAPWLSARVLRRAAAVAAVGYLAVMAAFVFARPAMDASEQNPWLFSATGAAVVAALLAGGTRAAWIVLVCALSGVVVARLRTGGISEHTVADDVQLALTGVVICVICAHLLVITRRLDAAVAAASVATARASAERGRLAARTRAAAVVHDEVLATLTLARADLPAERLATQARHAADMVRALTAEDAPAPPLATALADAARAAGARFTRTGGRLPAMDAPVRDALVAATRQALENSARHAGAAASRRVEVSGDDEHVRIRIVDDGAGFDPAEVPADRLGIRTSIVARVRDVGGDAVVDARPGEGTHVELTWRAPEAVALESEETSRELVIGLIVIAVVFVAGQTLSAIVAAFASTLWAVPLIVLAALLGAAEILRLTRDPVPSPARSALFVVVTVGTVAAAVGAVPYTVGTLWFAAGAAFLLLALTLRGRPGWALSGLGALLVVLAVAGMLAGASPLTVVGVLTRPVLIVVLGALFFTAVDRVQQRTRTLSLRALSSARREAWDEAERAELAVRIAELNRRVLPLLDRIGRDGAGDPAVRRECLALEGELRDEYRAGELAREPLVGAVRAARERGVDVVLLDDSGRRLPDEDLDAIAAWMAQAAASAREAVVGRLLPEGRGALATVTVDGGTTVFGG